MLLATNTYASSSPVDDFSSDSSDSKDNNGGDCVPLDGGLSILLLGAAAFGAKKLHDTRK
ncbi:PID-CTERM protein-sorting domain-containing protein [Litoribaculum gwangyangense]|uniref:PID-CTERM protein-sorting domain-containing protein n=1 Tax=Litoribaculum gwangyangense TaxID=1130722 RepID=UPI0031F0B7A0